MTTPSSSNSAPKRAVVVYDHRPTLNSQKVRDHDAHDSDARDGARLDSVIPDLETLARWMDGAFRIPGSNVRFGLDPVLGLLPGIGDTVSTVASLYILHSASRLGVSRATMSRMAFNVLIDYTVGCIPFVGDIFDVYWKANQKNIDLVRRHTLADETTRRRLEAGDRWFFLALAAVLVLALIGSILVAYWVLHWLGSKFFA